MNNAINSTLGFIFSILALSSPIIFYIFILNCYPTIKESNQHLLNKYGSLYDEFICDKGIMHLMYYPYFLIRRALYILVFYYLPFSPLSQVIINTGHSILTVLYICKYKPFKESKLTAYNLAQETIVSLSFTMTGLFLLKISDSKKFILAVFLIALATFSIILGYGLFGYKFFVEIRKRCRERRVVLGSGYSISKIKMNFEDSKRPEESVIVDVVSPMSQIGFEPITKIFVSRKNSYESMVQNSNL